MGSLPYILISGACGVLGGIVFHLAQNKCLVLPGRSVRKKKVGNEEVDVKSLELGFLVDAFVGMVAGILSFLLLSETIPIQFEALEASVFYGLAGGLCLDIVAARIRAAMGRYLKPKAGDAKDHTIRSLKDQVALLQKENSRLKKAIEQLVRSDDHHDKTE